MRLDTPVVWREVFSPTVRAQQGLEAHRQPGARLAFDPVLHHLFLGLGFLEGRPGFTYCANLAYYEFLIRIKMREEKARKLVKKWIPPAPLSFHVPCPPTHLKYRAHVDGLRAIAILAVIFFTPAFGFSGGYVGVDVFFVISGYLISALILKEWMRGSFTSSSFGSAGCGGILPALVRSGPGLPDRGLVSVFPRGFQETRPIHDRASHAGLEYLFLPGCRLLRAKHRDQAAVSHLVAGGGGAVLPAFPFLFDRGSGVFRRSPLPAIWLLGGGVFNLSIYCSYAHPRANFYLLPTRAWELLIGCFHRGHSRWRTSNRWLPELLSCRRAAGHPLRGILL